ncbi:unnamed protein product [Cladocopium goreaui]|uniref:Uncharacterized protein n=1 Tax=Cladocopium goreaui TaxID=2562237 RepID=A0A9P1CQ47_9DINO|nr:unnamed protein product [Cladocopium goreaui]
MRRRYKGGLEADAENQRTERQKEVSLLQQVLQFGFSGDARRSAQDGQSPPPLASHVAAFLGAYGCVRLARCAMGWQRFVPTGLRGEDLQRWALEHWPIRPVLEAPPQDITILPLMALWAPVSASELPAMLDTVFASFAREPEALGKADARGQLPLHVAARRGNAALLQLLLVR